MLFAVASRSKLGLDVVGSLYPGVGNIAQFSFSEAVGVLQTVVNVLTELIGIPTVLRFPRRS